MKLKLCTILMLLTLTAVPVLQSCKKYPDGPGFSVRSRKERVSNEWKIENYKINEHDFTSLASDYKESYSKNGGFAYWWGELSGSGSWEFRNQGEQIQLIGFDNQSSRTLFILKLEEKQFWYYYMDGTDKHEFHLIEK